jgi:hypothetical protein
VYIHIFLTSALDGGEWSGAPLNHFNTRETAPLHIRWKVGWHLELAWTQWQRIKMPVHSGHSHYTGDNPALPISVLLISTVKQNRADLLQLRSKILNTLV